MEKYIPWNLRDRRRDEFMSLEQGRMSVTAYEALQVVAAAKSFQEVVDFVIEVEDVKQNDFTMASTSKKFCKGGEFSGSYSRGQSLGGYPARPIQSSLQRPMFDSRECYRCVETRHIRRVCPKQSYRPPIIRGRGGHGRGRHSGGRVGQDNGGHQISRGGDKLEAVQHNMIGATDKQVIGPIVMLSLGGMTWLSPNFSILDCNSKTVTLSKPGTDPLVWESDYTSTPVHIISFLRAKRIVSKGCLAFLAHLRDENSQVPSIEPVSKVREFLDVFPADHPCMSPDRDIDLCIDQEPVTRPISIPLYRISPAELRVLKA
ncbi:uncharacterized protein [Solanum lycopersicum]|uniref:uncharacterized protein n=1 Tax=Solanum lycopersicum TaxID=4081 RepID=UPI0037487DED